MWFVGRGGGLLGLCVSVGEGVTGPLWCVFRGGVAGDVTGSPGQCGVYVGEGVTGLV